MRSSRTSAARSRSGHLTQALERLEALQNIFRLEPLYKRGLLNPQAVQNIMLKEESCCMLVLTSCSQRLMIARACQGCNFGSGIFGHRQAAQLKA